MGMSETETPSGDPKQEGWSIGKAAKIVTDLPLGQLKLPLPGWLLLILAIYIGVPDWNSRNQYWFSVAKSSGSIVSPAAAIVLWP
jgi:hypothetical protein